MRPLRIALAAAVAGAPMAAAAQSVTQTGAVQTPGSVQLQLNPITIFEQSCNGGLGGIVGQGSCTLLTGGAGAVAGSQSNASTGTTGATNIGSNSYGYVWDGTNAIWRQWLADPSGRPYVDDIGSAGAVFTQGTGAAGANSLNAFIGGGSIANTAFGITGSAAALAGQDAATGNLYTEAQAYTPTPTTVSIPSGTAAGNTTLVNLSGAATVEVAIATYPGAAFSFVFNGLNVSAVSVKGTAFAVSPLITTAAPATGQGSFRINVAGPGALAINFGAATTTAATATITQTSAALPLPYTFVSNPNASPVPVASYIATTTATAFTGSATANTFTSPLAASTVRRDCTIFNTVAFSIAPGSSPAANIAIPAGATTGGYLFKCSSSSIVMGDQINVSSATASPSYVVWSQ